MLDDRLFREVVVSLYDGATGTEPWQTPLSHIGRAFDASVAILLSQSPGESDSVFLGRVGLEETAQRRYQDYFAARNVLMQRGAALHQPGVVRTTETICSPAILLKSEFYNHFLRPQDIRYSMGVTAVRDSDATVQVSVFRPHRAVAFERRDMQALSALYPHARRAIQLHLGLALKAQRTRALEEVVGRLARGVAFLDRNGRVIYLNPPMERMLEARDGLALLRGGIEATAPRAARELREAVADAMKGGSGGNVAVDRPSGQLPYALLISPVLRGVPFLGRSHPAVSIVASDPAGGRDASVIALQRIYGLTRAEARVASRVAGGATLPEIAAQLSVSILTVRTHLKRVLAKTDTRRQSELVRRVLLLTR